MSATAEIITIGDEILYGQTLDTNSHWMSSKLDEIGIKVRYKTTVGDVKEDILNSFKAAEERVDIVLITGGLGPTKDDLTKPLLNEYFQSHLVLNEAALEDITAIFAKSGRPVTPINRQQAEIPAVCERVPNKLGTAPGMWFPKGDKVFISMPGVPFEMRRMMTDTILPRLQKQFVDQVIYHQMIRTIGVGESALAEIISDWEDNLPTHMKLAYLPTLGMVKLRLTAIGTNYEALKDNCKQQVTLVEPLIKQYIYGYDDRELEYHMGQILFKAGKTIAFAESCTGGYLSHLMTTIPGSSAYYAGSVVSYSYDVKENVLGVDHETLETKGAVSEEVVRQMAESVRKKLNTDIGISISGIAGPDGGTEEKPVGTVWIAYSDKEKTVAKKFNFSKDRVLNIQYSAYMALNMFRLNFAGAV
ncbi:competence/damage-inducible protein A [Marinoscillum sp. MHG1-6]|uniref:competence/damage-inducible protein A n=1 Tax=Marinoscillum sp. MHG1-6 TaxID=2959627 RepID=UPI0021583ADC|nr:competence/damage-inducible protein A [Marinoscillum sp. MHG1-6]